MSTINDLSAGITRKSQNLRGLYDHARRVAHRDARPLCTTVDRVTIEAINHGRPSLPWRSHVVVYYHGGDVGQTLFADHSIAKKWAQCFAERRGGELEVLPDMSAAA